MDHGRAANTGLTVREALSTSALADSTVLAGHQGLERVIERLNVMEVPDILPWVKPHELLLTTAYPLRESPEALADLVTELDARELAGVGVKLGRYLDALPDAMLERADALAFPVVQLPSGVAFDDVLNQLLGAILNQQAAVLARSQRVQRTLSELVLSGGGLAAVAESLSELLDAAVLIIDRDGGLLAAARLEPVRERLAAAGLLHEGRVTVAVSEPVLADAAEQLRYLAVPIAPAEGYGALLAVEHGRPLDGDDLVALQSAATVAALELTKSHAVAAVESKFRSDFVHELIAGRVTDEEARRRAAALGWQIDRPLLVAVGRGAPEPAEALERTADRVAASVRELDPGGTAVALGHEIVALVDARTCAAREPHGADRLREALSAGAPPAMRWGLSRPAHSVAGVPAAYQQADQAAHVADRRDGGVLARFDELGADRLLCLIEDRDELRAFARDTLGSLLADDEGAADLRRTLAVLLETGGNLAEAARRLHFHYNTLRYRVEKLERLVGPFTSDERVRLDVALALRILELRDVDVAPPPRR